MDSYYLDSNIFFYAKIDDRKYGDSCARILTDLTESKITGATSTLALLEVSNALRKYNRPNDVAEEVQAIYSLDILIHELSNLDVRSAAEIFEKSRVSPYDCAHAAIMRRVGLSKILTANKKDFARIKDLTVVDPVDYAEKRKTRKSYSGASQGIGPFTGEDEMKAHD